MSTDYMAANFLMSFPLTRITPWHLDNFSFVEGEGEFYLEIKYKSIIEKQKDANINNLFKCLELPETFSILLKTGDLLLLTVNLYSRKSEYLQLVEELKNSILSMSQKFFDESKRDVEHDNITKALVNSPLYKKIKQWVFYLSILDFINEPQNQDICNFFITLIKQTLSFYGECTRSQLKRSLSRMEMKYKWDVKTSVSINEPSKELSFSFKSFKELLVFDLSRIITHSAGNIRKCENCGNYFFSTVRSDEIYCKYPFGNNTCKATGYLNKLKNDDIMSTYRRIYKTQNARKHRNKDKVLNIEEKFSKWEKAALKKRAECKTGKCSLEEMVKSISGSSWLKE